MVVPLGIREFASNDRHVFLEVVVRSRIRTETKSAYNYSLFLSPDHFSLGTSRFSASLAHNALTEKAAGTADIESWSATPNHRPFMSCKYVVVF